MVRKRLSAEERREQILHVAANEFARMGLELTRLKDIAEKCGVNESLIYQHFPCKEDLYIESMKYAQTEMLGGWVAVISGEVNGLDVLREVLMARTKVVFEHPHLAKLVEQASVASSSDIRIMDLNRKFFTAMQEYFETLVTRGQEDGSIRSDINPSSAAYWIRGFSHLVNLSVIIEMDEKFSMETAQMHLDNLIELLKPAKISVKAGKNPKK